MKSIEVDDMVVQWEIDDGTGVYVNVPLGSVFGKGADGGYGDGCSALGGASSRSDVCQKRKRTKTEPKIHSSTSLPSHSRTPDRHTTGGS